jgi:hypothetical protein
MFLIKVLRQRFFLYNFEFFFDDFTRFVNPTAVFEKMLLEYFDKNCMHFIKTILKNVHISTVKNPYYKTRGFHYVFGLE